MIPKFVGELSSLRILLLGKNNFSVSIPKQLCRLTNASLIDLSNTFFLAQYQVVYKILGAQVTKLSCTPGIYIMKVMIGMNFHLVSIIRVIIPEELGLLTHIHVLHLSHNKLTGPIPAKFCSLASIESLDLSFNNLSGKVPSELIKLNSLEVFNVSFNNLSGTLPMKAQFGTFSKESYDGNPLLCGPPLENKCTMETKETNPSIEKGDDVKWYDMDMTSFYGSY
ncbi:putative non-specific serine/threonine protein kinase [Helianthus annuus]|nr:putative non-specific serine/threonine protein kinase [Helianthus annuus]